jgi:hypothetical protein
MNDDDFADVTKIDIDIVNINLMRIGAMLVELKKLVYEMKAEQQEMFIKNEGSLKSLRNDLGEVIVSLARLIMGEEEWKKIS